MIPRKSQCFNIIHLVLPRTTLQKKICYADHLIQRSPDLMAHCRHELLFGLSCLFSFMACHDHIIYHYSSLYCNSYLICYKFKNVDIILRKFFLVMIILKCHYTYNFLVGFQWNTHPYFTRGAFQGDIS